MPPSTRSPGRRALVRVVGQDAVEGHLAAPRTGRGRRVARASSISAGGDPQAVGHVDPVERGRLADHGGVALGAHLEEDPRHHVVHVGPGGRGPRQGGVERRRGAAEVQDTEGHEVTRLPAGPRGPFRAGRRRGGRATRGPSAVEPLRAGVRPSARARRAVPDRPSSWDVIRRRDLLPVLHPRRAARAGHRHGRGRAVERRRGHGARAHRGRTCARRRVATPAPLLQGSNR